MFMRFTGKVIVPKMLRKGEELWLLRLLLLGKLLLMHFLLLFKKSLHVFSSSSAQLAVMSILYLRFDLDRAAYLSSLSLNWGRP